MRALRTLVGTYRQIRLIVVGHGPYFQDLINLSEEMKLSEYVSFVGFVEEKDLPQYYRCADLFVFSAFREPFGLVLLEAMSSCLPVVAPNEGGPTEIVINGKTGLLFEQNNIADLSAKIEFFVTHPKETEEMGKNARQRAAEFSWERHYGVVKRCLLEQ